MSYNADTIIVPIRLSLALRSQDSSESISLRGCATPLGGQEGRDRTLFERSSSFEGVSLQSRSSIHLSLT